MGITRCKQCQKRQCRKCANRRRTEYKLRRNRAIIDAAKSRPCVDCKDVHPVYVMEFDHSRGKKRFVVSDGVKTLKLLLREIAKCDVVCANCHRIRTHKRRKGK